MYLRIYLTVVAALALFALVSGWLVQRHVDEQRVRSEAVARERIGAWGELLARSLPTAEAPPAEQAQALRDWAQRLRVPVALDDARGQRIAQSDNFARREAENRPGFAERLRSIRLDDGRTLHVLRPAPMRQVLDGEGAAGAFASPGPEGSASGAVRWPRRGQGRDFGEGRGEGRSEGRGGPRASAEGPLDWATNIGPSLAPWLRARGWPEGMGLAVLLLVLFAAVAAGAYPVVRHLTRRLEGLKLGVEAFGAGALNQRVAEEGQDEVAAVAASFNRAAARVQALVQSHQTLLANASHELRSPLARLKMAFSLFEEAPAEQRAALKAEITRNIAELDALVEEVLLSSRLDAGQANLAEAQEPVELLALVAEEAAHVDAQVDGQNLTVLGDERLLRRAVRNLLENGKRYGGDALSVRVQQGLGARAQVWVCDRGPGVPADQRERIFEPFYRLPGHAERAGGVGLGLALVRQIAHRHSGQVHCEPREGGGSCFVLSLPVAGPRPAQLLAGPPAPPVRPVPPAPPGAKAPGA